MLSFSFFIKYILQKTTIRYVLNTLNKKTFVPFKEIKAEKTLKRVADEKANEMSMTFEYTYMLRNAAVLLILFIVSVLYLAWDSPVLILFLFPLSYLFAYSERKAYKMPYIYDIYALFEYIISKIYHTFKRAKTLKNTTKSETIQISQSPDKIKKES